jgi:ABC-type multidrug transport system permease subunit
VWSILLSVFNCLLGGMALGTILSVIMPSLESVNLILPIVASPLVMLMGSFVSVKSLNWVLFLFSFLSPVKYVYQGMLLIEFSNRQLYLDSCKLPLQIKNLCDP